MQRDPVRVALIGCGRWGRHILRDLKILDCTVPVVVTGPTSGERAMAGGASEVHRAISDIGHVAGIVVATPTATHAAVVDEALEHGVPVFVEKPLTADVFEARRLVERAPERLFQMDKWRYHPGIERLRDLAGDGSLGHVQGVESTRIQWESGHTDVDAVWVLAPHDLSIVLEILGRLPSPKAAVSSVDAATGDVALWGLLGERPFASIRISSRSEKRLRRVVVHGDEATAVLDDANDDAVVVHRPGRPTEGVRHPVSTEYPLLRELRAFVEHLAGGPPPHSSARDALTLIEAISALRQLAGLGGRAGPGD